MKPRAQGTKHCQRYSPAAGGRNVNEIVSWALLSEHGALAHRFLEGLGGPGGGTERPDSGTANTCEATVGSIACVGLPLSMKLPPTVPVACEMNSLRSPVW